MPKGRTTRLTVRLTTEERQTLEAWQRMQTIPVGRARRARIVLLLAAGLPITRIAHTVGVSRRFVYKWVQRFQTHGLEGLRDLPRPGRWHHPRPAEAAP